MTRRCCFELFVACITFSSPHNGCMLLKDYSPDYGCFLVFDLLNFLSSWRPMLYAVAHHQ